MLNGDGTNEYEKGTVISAVYGGAIHYMGICFKGYYENDPWSEPVLAIGQVK